MLVADLESVSCRLKGGVDTKSLVCAAEVGRITFSRRGEPVLKVMMLILTCQGLHFLRRSKRARASHCAFNSNHESPRGEASAHTRCADDL